MLDTKSPKSPQLLELYTWLQEQHSASTGTYGNWKSNFIHLKAYLYHSGVSVDIPLSDLTVPWVEGYRHYLLQHIDNCNTAATYYTKFKACLRYAMRRGWVSLVVFEAAGSIHTFESERTYLTLEELRRLTLTPCPCEPLRRTFLFACLTGLRKSDIIRLRWEQVVEENGFVRLIFRQQKTQGLEYLDITPQAALLLGVRSSPIDCVFADFHYSSYMLCHLRRWAVSAGITKHITFHTSRHTFAVLMLSLNTDLYTLQRLLGHHSIETTQRYAHIYDEQKRDAVMRIPAIGV